jgi:transcriptional regulator with XRE-family HTH domain
MFVWRRMNKMSQKDVAKMFGLHQTSVSKMEKGELGVSARIQIEPALSIPLGLRLAVLRRRKRLTIGAAAKQIGIHEHRISEMERGRRPVSDAYLRLVE